MCLLFLIAQTVEIRDSVVTFFTLLRLTAGIYLILFCLLCTFDLPVNIIGLYNRLVLLLFVFLLSFIGDCSVDIPQVVGLHFFFEFGRSVRLFRDTAFFKEVHLRFLMRVQKDFNWVFEW